MSKKENGAIMVEGIFVMVVVMIMLIWILGIGFMYYQRNLVASVTNDCAVKIADTYPKLPKPPFPKRMLGIRRTDIPFESSNRTSSQIFY